MSPHFQPDPPLATMSHHEVTMSHHPKWDGQTRPSVPQDTTPPHADLLLAPSSSGWSRAWTLPGGVLSLLPRLAAPEAGLRAAPTARPSVRLSRVQPCPCCLSRRLCKRPVPAVATQGLPEQQSQEQGVRGELAAPSLLVVTNTGCGICHQCFKQISCPAKHIYGKFLCLSVLHQTKYYKF